MSLRDVMAFIQKHQTAGAADTPDTPSKPMGYQLKPAWIGACTPDTPDTPHLYEVGTNTPIARPGAAANDHDVGDVAYDSAVTQPGALPWQQQAGRRRD